MTQNPTAATPSRVSGLLRSFAHRLAGDDAVLPVEGHLASFDGATGWLNSEPLTPDGLRGRVVLVDFWTYTCVNWLRTLPYIRAWVEKYGDQGLTVVGVHTPEFGFEHDVDNVRAQVRELGVEFPVALDNDYGVWRAFANHFWPAIYLADAEGRIRFHHFGEGEYAMTEMVIQQLLIDAGAADVDQGLVEVEPRGLEVPADWRVVQSPETYVGYGQSTGFASEGGRRLRPAACLRAPAAATQPVGAVRDLDRGASRRAAERARRTARVPLPRARPEPGHGPGVEGRLGRVPRDDRRPAAQRRAWDRHRRRRHAERSRSSGPTS